MIIPVSQASGKRCSRRVNYEYSYSSGGSVTEVTSRFGFCAGSLCMHWAWAESSTGVSSNMRKGFCGLGEMGRE
jgi:hypothetical protein